MLVTVQFKKTKETKTRYRPFRIGGGGGLGSDNVHVFRCQQPNEVLKKRTKFTVLYRVPNLKKTKQNKEDKQMNKDSCFEFRLKKN